MFFSLYRWMQGDNAMTIVGTDGLTIIVLALGAALAMGVNWHNEHDDLSYGSGYEDRAWDCCPFFVPDISDEDQHSDVDIESDDWQVIAMDRFTDRILTW